MNMDKKYLIKLECIDEGNPFNLKYGEIVYACGFDGSDYTHNINMAATGMNLDYMKEIARRIDEEGYFMPSIHEVIIELGPSIKF